MLLHLGTLIAVFAAYWGDIRDMVVEFFRGIGDLVARQHPHTGAARPAAHPADHRRYAAAVRGAAHPQGLDARGWASNTVCGGPRAAGLHRLPAVCLRDRVRRGRKTERSATHGWTRCWWARHRRWPPAPACPVPAPPLPPGASSALNGNLPCGIPSSCLSPPFWAPIS